MTAKNRMKILGVPVDRVDMGQAMEIFEALMEEEGCSLIVTPNSEIILNAGREPALKEVIEGADLIIPDGIGLVYASKIKGKPLKERVTGIDFADNVLIWLSENGKSVFFLGSKPANDEKPSVAELAAEKKKAQYPELKVAGTHHGYFGPADEEEILRQINDSGADFLCVALGSPKQEQFVRKYQNQLKVRAAVGVGGSLDVWAGTLKRAPEFYRKHGLEWFYRLVQEPSRYKRMLALPVFMIKVLFSGKEDS